VKTGAREQGRGVGGLSRQASAWLAWSLWTLSLALTALSLLLLALSLSHPNTHIFDWWYNNALIVVDVTVGAIVASRRPENPVGWLLCLIRRSIYITFTSPLQHRLLCERFSHRAGGLAAHASPPMPRRPCLAAYGCACRG
jgi:hypothetical protein